MPSWLRFKAADKIRSRFALLGAAHVAGALCSFLATLIVVRALGATGLGHVSLGLTVLTYALVVANFGADIYAVQTTARDPATLAGNLTAVILIRSMLALPTFAIILALCASGLWDVEARIAVALFGLSVFANAVYPLWVPQALERVGIIAWCNLGGQVLNLAFTAAAASMRTDIWGYAAARVGADLILALGLLAWVHRHAGGFAWRHSLGDLLEFLRRTAPLGASQLLRSLALGSDILILSFFVTAAMVGQYAASFRIFTLLLSIGSLYFVIVLPIFSRRAREGREPLEREFADSMRRSLPPTILGAAGIAAAAHPILGMLFGAEFAAGATSLQLLMVALAANYMHRTYRQVLLATGQRSTDLRSTIAGTAVNLVLKLLLIPSLGILGAAAGTAAGEVLLLILQRRAARQAIRSVAE